MNDEFPTDVNWDSPEMVNTMKTIAKQIHSIEFEPEVPEWVPSKSDKSMVPFAFNDDEARSYFISRYGEKTEVHYVGKSTRSKVVVQLYTKTIEGELLILPKEKVWVS